MPRKTKTQQLLDMDIRDFNRMTKKELKQAVRTLSYTANRRLRSFEAEGEESPATRYAQESGGRFTGYKKDTVNDLRAEFMRAKGFIEAPTSTLEGWEETRSSTLDTLEEKYGIEDFNEEDWDRVWKAYERLKETDKRVTEKQFKYNVIEEIASMAKGDRRLSFKTLARRMEVKLDYMVETQERELNYDKGVSRFIKIRDDT